MQSVVEYLLCVIATFYLSEFPLHILELVDEKDAITATHHNEPGQKRSEHDEIPRDSFDLRPAPHPRHDNNDRPSADTIAQRNTSYGILLAIVVIPSLYALWRVIFFTCQMQLSKQESLLFQCFYWSFTLPTAARLMYGLSACARFYIYVFRPRWLPQGTPLRLQAFRACALALALIMNTVAVVVLCLLVKILVYDNSVKLAVMIFGVRA